VLDRPDATQIEDKGKLLAGADPADIGALCAVSLYDLEDLLF